MLQYHCKECGQTIPPDEEYPDEGVGYYCHDCAQKIWTRAKPTIVAQTRTDPPATLRFTTPSLSELMAELDAMRQDLDELQNNVYALIDSTNDDEAAACDEEDDWNNDNYDYAHKQPYGPANYTPERKREPLTPMNNAQQSSHPQGMDTCDNCGQPYPIPELYITHRTKPHASWRGQAYYITALCVNCLPPFAGADI